MNCCMVSAERGKRQGEITGAKGMSQSPIECNKRSNNIFQVLRFVAKYKQRAWSYLIMDIIIWFNPSMKWWWIC